MTLGNLGPVSEGMFIWIFGLGIMVGIAVWLGRRPRDTRYCAWPQICSNRHHGRVDRIDATR